MESGADQKKGSARYLRIRHAANAAYHRFLEIRGEPREIAAGLALGVFIGMTPFMGVQAAVAVLLASLFRINKIAAAAGVFITNPFTAPVIYPITYLAGSFFYRPDSAGDPAVLMSSGAFWRLFEKAPDILAALVIGGVVLGLPLSIAAYRLSLSAILKYREKVKIRLAKEREALARAKQSLVGRVENRKKRKKKKKPRNR
ncbi:MAG: DUF2062 domain-containing protein [Thermodesulfobacteriota bacterium]